MKNSLRFNPKQEWNLLNNGNRYFFGLNEMLFDLFHLLKDKKNIKMLEIGSYKGESTFMFAASGIFAEIHCIDPHEGAEQANKLLDNEWDTVKEEFKINTRFFSNITHYQDYSYNVVDKFEDKYFDFIYIDASHEYSDVKQDIELYLPKTKFIIGGHDYQPEWPGVIKAVNEKFEKPDKVFADESWLKLV